MTEAEIFQQLLPLVQEVTGVPAEQIRMDQVLMLDLAAESLDLVDLTFLIEERFNIIIRSDEFESQARARIPGGIYEREGFLTEPALAELRVALPEVDPRRLVPPLKRVDLPSLLTVSVFVHLIQRKLAECREETVHA